MNRMVNAVAFREFQNGNEQAFQQIIDQESRFIMNCILRYIKREVEAEEILQDVFLEVWEIRSSFNSYTEVSNRIFTSSRFRSLKHLRKKTPDLEYIDDVVSLYEHQNGSEIQSDLELREIAAKIGIVINEMPRMRQQVYKMCCVEGANREEIAKQLEISPNAVSQHLSRAVDDIKKALILIIIFGNLPRIT